MNNYAFIDGQNLRIGTTGSREPWRVDLYKFRRYLREKYNVVKAYYFIGYMDKKYRRLYEAIKRAGFELVFRVCMKDTYSSKKVNVDTDIVFAMMRDFHEQVGIDKLYLVSGDSDYYKTILYLRCETKGSWAKLSFRHVSRHRCYIVKLAQNILTIWISPRFDERLNRQINKTSLLKGEVLLLWWLQRISMRWPVQDSLGIAPFGLVPA